VIEIDFGLLGAGTKLRSEADERVRALLAAARDRAGQVILFLPDLAQLVGDKAGQGAGSLFAAALGRGEVRGIALATPEGPRRRRRRTRSFCRASRPSPSSRRPPTKPWRSCAGWWGATRPVMGSRSVIKRSRRRCAWRAAYVQSAMLPKAAIDLIDEAAARVRVEMGAAPAELEAMQRRLNLLVVQLESLVDDTEDESKRTHGKLDAEASALRPQVENAAKAWQTAQQASAGIERIEKELKEARAARDAAATAGDNARAGELRFGTIPLLEKQLETARAAIGTQPVVRDRVMESDVADVVAAWTGVPVSRMLQEETQKLLAMEDSLRKRVVGQDPAVAAVSRAVRRGRVGLRDPKRPIGSFLFLGPTGVGKTELAKALAEFLFDDEVSLTRLDMSEFMEKHSVARLLGSPPGYVDSEEGGFLTEAVRKRPLLGDLVRRDGEGASRRLQHPPPGARRRPPHRLARSAGPFRGHRDHHDVERGQRLDPRSRRRVTKEAIRAQLDHELRKHFRPEFLNRIDDTVIFDPLGKKDLRGIVEIQLKLLSRMVGRARGTPRGDRRGQGSARRDGLRARVRSAAVKRVILKNLQDLSRKRC
jgi:ATP-dependent Clp protease ATP-binding subunit ClpB